jgi:hypothetical protein
MQTFLGVISLIVILIVVGFIHTSYVEWYNGLPIQRKCEVLSTMRLEYMNAGDYVLMEECRELDLLGKK